MPVLDSIIVFKVMNIGLLFLLLLCCELRRASDQNEGAKDPHDMRLVSKFNRSMCTKESLEAVPIRLIYASRKNVRVPVNKPYILANFDLQKY